MAATNFDVKALARVAALAESLSPTDIRSISKLVDHVADAPEGEIMLAESVPLVREDGTSAGSIDLVDGDWVFVFGADDEDDEDEEPAAPAKTKAKPAAKAKAAPKDEEPSDEDEEDEGDTPMALSEPEEKKPTSKAASRRPAQTDDDDF